MIAVMEPQNALQRSRPLTILRAVLKRWGASAVKRKIWDDEYAAGKWKAIDPQDRRERRDIVYGPVEFHARGGDVLDLGCGTGSTAVEMEDVYHSYLGVDISPVAIHRAEQLIRQDHEKAASTAFVAADIASFLTDRRFDVILYRECLYYFSLAQIKLILARHARYLRPGGVFIVRLHDRQHFQKIVSYISRTYPVIEQLVPSSESTIVLVFRPRSRLPEPGLAERIVREDLR